MYQKKQLNVFAVMQRSILRFSISTRYLSGMPVQNVVVPGVFVFRFSRGVSVVFLFFGVYFRSYLPNKNKKEARNDTSTRLVHRQHRAKIFMSNCVKLGAAWLTPSIDGVLAGSSSYSLPIRGTLTPGTKTVVPRVDSGLYGPITPGTTPCLLLVA